MLTPNVVNKVVAFDMICRANGVVPDCFVFKYFFRFYATCDKYTLGRGHTLVPDGKTPRNGKKSGCSSTKIGSVVGGSERTTLLVLFLSCILIF